MFPLLFFVVKGASSIDHTQYNNQVLHTMGSFAGSESETASYKAEQGLVYITVMAIIVRCLPSITTRLLRYPSLLLLPFLAGVSAIWSQNPAKTLSHTGYILATALLGAYLVGRFDEERRLELFALLSLVTISLTLLVVAFFPHAGIDQSTSATGAWEGIFINKNNCSECLIYLSFAVFYSRTTTHFPRFVAIGCIAATILIVAFTQSRTGWLLLPSSFGFAVILQFAGKLRSHERFLTIVLVAIVATGVAVFCAAHAAELSVLLGKDSTMTGRTTIWSSISPILWKRPLSGYGYMAFWMGLRGESANVILSARCIALANAENAVLQIWLELGLVGISCLAVSLFVACKNALTCIRQGQTPYTRWCSMILFVTLLALVDGDKIMSPHTIEWLFYVVAYIGLADEAGKLRKEKTHVPHLKVGVASMYASA